MYMVQATIATIIACVDVCVVDNMVYMVQATIATIIACVDVCIMYRSINKLVFFFYVGTGVDFYNYWGEGVDFYNYWGRVLTFTIIGEGVDFSIIGGGC